MGFSVMSNIKKKKSVLSNMKKKIKKKSVMSNMKKKKKIQDRISLLPDSLLHLILSSLNTEQVVQTCVLSKRWKTLWTHVPTLNFDFESYRPLVKCSRQRSFKYFIIRVLSQHCATNIQKLSYHSSTNKDELVLVDLLKCFAGCHNIQQLCINTYNIKDIFYDWKYYLSTCSSLIVPKIVCQFVDDLGVLSLPSLRILEIECDWEERDEEEDYSGITMFSGCPNLESLVLVNYLFESATIFAPKLENLELCASFDSELTFPELELLTPSLKSVKFSNVLPTVKSNSEFSCIHKLNIELEDSKFETADKSRPNVTSNLSELLTVFQNARSFTLPLKATQVILSHPFHSKGLCFGNMRHLRLKTDQTSMLLAYLLKRPNLEMFAVLNEVNKDRTV